MTEHSEKTMDSNKPHHTGEKPYECRYCEMKFSGNPTLLTHERWHTEEKPYYCNYCDDCFTSNKELKCHKLIHKAEISYECEHCSMTFSGNKSRLNHLKKFHPEAKPFPYKCTECEKTFKRNDQLENHKRQHTGEKPYQCSTCERSYKTKNILRSHMNMHNRESVEKSYKCKYCTKTFLKIDNLNIHIITHGRELKKVYPCIHCYSTFSRKDNLKKHMDNHIVLKESSNSSLCNKANQGNSLNNSVLHKTIHISHLLTHTNPRGVWLGKVKQSHMKTKDVASNRKSKFKDHIISDEISTSDQSAIPLFCDDSTKVILWLQQNKLLKSVWSCDSCCTLLNWSETSMSKDGFEWICQTKRCMKYQQGVCIKLGSLFDKSCVTLPDWFDIMYLWSENVKANVSSNLTNVSHSQIMDCYASFREVCWSYFIENPIKLGGPETVIEIDVARFSGNPETNQDKPPIVVLGILDSKSSPLNGYMEIVESSDAASLLPKLLNVVKPGSIIYTKESKEYRKLQGIAEMDTEVNHSINFLDINTSEHVTNMESFWEKHRNNINEIHECKEMDQNSYLQEFMWRDCFYSDSFNRLCQQISDQYPL